MFAVAAFLFPYLNDHLYDMSMSKSEWIIGLAAADF